MIKELVEKITRASQEYYEFGESFLSDSEFDKELETLRKLDPENPILKEVGHGYILKGIDDKEKFEHPIEVGSIEKTKELSRLKEFLNPSSTFSTKIDGNSVVCYYKNGNLFKVVTRGTKNIGIDRTAKFISIVPNKIPLKGYVAVRGEAAIKKELYTEANGFDISKSSRNAVAGAISRKDDYMEIFKYVVFVAYTFKDCDTGEDLYNEIPWGEYFIVEDQKTNVKDIFQNVESFKNEYKTNYPYEADGIVFKTGSEYLAFKFEDESANTKLHDIDWSIGKDQRLTPVAILEPVELAGATISRASLGSYSRACEIDCWPVRSKHTVELIRANEVIPYVTKTVECSCEGFVGDHLPSCPSCGKYSEQIGEHVYCTNLECPNLDRARLFNFSEQFYPEGLSDKIVEKFFEFEGIDTIFELLEYDQKSIDVLNCPGIGESHKEKIYQFLKAFSGEIDSRVVYKTFLNQCGERAAEKIVDSGFDLIQFLETESEINKLKTISNFNSNILQELISKKSLLKEFVQLRNIKTERKTKMEANKTFVITGTRFKGEELEQVLSKGWKEGSSVSKNTDVLIVKDVSSNSSKTQKAKDLGIKIMSIPEFLEFI
jgi:DNA ligase (NAD+)